MKEFEKWWKKHIWDRPCHEDAAADAWRAALGWYQSVAETCEKDCTTIEDFQTLYYHLKQVLKNEVGK